MATIQGEELARRLLDGTVDAWVQICTDSWEESVDVGEVRFVLRISGGDAVNSCEGFSGGMLWPSAIVLASWLYACHAQSPWDCGCVTVLELGSGCGLAGLALAKLGMPTLLTDHHSAVLCNLRHNAQLNGVRVGVEFLAWAVETDRAHSSRCGVDVELEPSAAKRQRVLAGSTLDRPPCSEQALTGAPFTLVIGADLMYLSDSMAALAATIRRCCNGLFLAVSPSTERAGLLPLLRLLCALDGWTVRTCSAPRAYTASLCDEYTLVCAQHPCYMLPPLMAQMAVVSLSDLPPKG